MTKQAGLHDWPAWSPDGRRVVFITTFGRRESIDVINVDSTRLKRLTTGSRYAYLDWQPLP